MVSLNHKPLRSKDVMVNGLDMNTGSRDSQLAIPVTPPPPQKHS